MDLRTAVGSSGAHVPAHWFLEVANGLCSAARRGRVDALRLAAFIQGLGGLDLTMDPDNGGGAFGPVLTLARHERLSAYDAAYLDLALRRQLPLATRDEALATAARRLGISLIPA